MRWRYFCCAMLLPILCASRAAAGQSLVPEVIAFQASLYDDGGNPVADGPVELALRVKDAMGNVLYEEFQTPDAVGGEVSLLLGNGLTGEGAPTGGIPPSLLNPGEARFIEAEVEGEPPTSPMEIASVPYALHAKAAYSVADGSVLFESLADGVLEELAAALSGDAAGPKEVIVREDLSSMYAGPESASVIGVTQAFNYSASGDVQGVLADLDVAIKVRDQRISSEATARLQGDQALSASISAEAAARKSADSALSLRIDSIDPQVNPPPVPQFHANAWCRVSSCLVQPATASCANASASALGISQCRVAFDADMPDSNYAVILSPAVSVASREAGGFTVNCQGAASCAFDFVVMAR